MAEKKGAGGKNQPFDTKTGRYGSESQATGEYDSLPSARKITRRAEKVIGKIEAITKHDYSTIRSEVFRKQSQLGYNKKRDYVYSANYFYVFDNHDIDNFTINIKVAIVGNEKYIDMIWKELENG
ncbi:MAG: hypothetical protein J1G01_04480 [Clostridiales bacterium]|nr:hypothetical protein [Clostridiales bacterium]